MRRVAVTGIGVVSAAGGTREAFRVSLENCLSGIAPMQSVDCTKLKFGNAAEVRDFDCSKHFDEKSLDYVDRFAQFAIVAAREAINDAGITWSEELRERTAIVMGSCVGGQSTEDTGFVDLYRLGKPRVNPLTIPRVMANAGASHISMDCGVTGPCFAISTACSSSNHAIGQAFWMVRSGMAEMALTGGSESPFSMGHLKAWEAMRVVAPDTCRPFSRDRKGMILGEGGAVLVIEPLEAATARGAHIYGEIVGFGMSSDATHITQPAVSGAARAIKAALRDACIAPECVNYVNAHGTGTGANDPTETSAIRNAFNSHADKLAISGTKSIHGHSLGASGAMEAAATLLGMDNGFIPPTANFNEADPACDLDIVTNAVRRAHIEYAVSNAFAFGGLNAVLVLRHAR